MSDNYKELKVHGSLKRWTCIVMINYHYINRKMTIKTFIAIIPRRIYQLTKADVNSESSMKQVDENLSNVLLSYIV